MKLFFWGLALSLTSLSLASAPIPVKFLPSAHYRLSLPQARLAEELRSRFASRDLREIRVQPITNRANHPDHLLVQLLSKHFHRVDFARVDIDDNFHILTIDRSYIPEKEDEEQQPGIRQSEAKCPDDSIQFITFCPNDDSFEQGITSNVAKAAKAHGLKVIELTLATATRSNWLNYMACPNLKGNFYDGDADPYGLTTVDGVLYSSDVLKYLKNQWKFDVTNIWVACEAYNDPMLSAVEDDAEAKKYAAGVNDLDIGPSDNAAQCAMEAALDGKPMQSSFDECVRAHDDARDQWGYGGKGTDQF